TLRMELRGIISDGRIVVDGGVDLPEGTRVSLSVEPLKSGRRGKKSQPSTKPTDPLLLITSFAVRTGHKDLADRHNELFVGSGRLPKRRASRAKGRK
ncbi:MAG: hypothetical protein K2Q20_02795, partial [Phycisphaerales bacterium]|nr:hypothetical protein [Phycisphaerales bacterium]